ncbi:MAG TPA: protein kinase, partial [Thermoprotei archaeon]|nr:protein kinase [Thermoprotei archaeon]
FEVDVKKHIIEEARRLARKYGKIVRGLNEESWNKVLYFVERDLLGYGPINALMEDWNLEDISCDGVNRAIHVWHRKYESIPTNIVFVDREYLREFIIKLAHLGGKHVSAAFPIVDTMLPGRHRLAATFGEEVSPRGSTFTIRKFREKPFSIVELISEGNIDTWTAAYLWLMLENRMTLMIIGGTAAGKTTFLNAIASFIKPGMKIVTIEETAELNLPHVNWVQLISRESYGLGESKLGEISLYDLVRVSLRYRPDYIIVGEIRGAEAFVLFQAMATGHGGLTTFHADSLQNAIRRLMSPPMNISEPYIPMLNIVIYVSRTALPNGTFGRRLRDLWEIEDYGKYRRLVVWDMKNDRHMIVSDSYLLDVLSERLGRDKNDLLDEIARRQIFLLWLKERKILEMKDVARHISMYYNFPEEMYEKAYSDLRRMGIDIDKYVIRRLAPIIKMEKAVAKEAYRPIEKPVAKIEITTRATEKIEKVEKEKVEAEPIKTMPHISLDEIKLLRIVENHGGEIDLKSALNESGLSKESFWKVVSNLRRERLIQTSLMYIDNKPLLGFKLTARGEEFLKRK